MQKWKSCNQANSLLATPLFFMVFRFSFKKTSIWNKICLHFSCSCSTVWNIHSFDYWWRSWFCDTGHAFSFLGTCWWNSNFLRNQVTKIHYNNGLWGVSNDDWFTASNLWINSPSNTLARLYIKVKIKLMWVWSNCNFSVVSSL